MSNQHSNPAKSIKQVLETIKKVSKELNCHPSELKQAEILGNSDLVEWDLRKHGGHTGIIKAHFPVTGKDLKVIQENKHSSTYIAKLEKELGNKLILEEQILEEVTNHFKPVGKIKPQSLKSKKSGNIQREMIAMLNDTHIGVIVDPEEVNNGNSFDFKEAGRRFAYFAKEVCNYKLHARHETKKLHLILNGDLIAGIIHGLETRSIHLLTHQINGATHIFANTIAHLAKDFNEIEIHCLVGNHERGIHKGHGKRAVSEVYDSYANIMFYALSAIFKNNSQIKFNVPKTPYGFINLPAGRAMYAHGDHIFSKALGNPGSSINVKSLSSAIKDFNAGEVSKGNKPIKLLLLAHVHTFAHFITNDGVEVYIAPSLSGLDQYAHSLTINNNFIAQVVFESTNKYILGDSRLVRLNDADNDKSLDKIIPEYKKELKWKK